MAKNEDKAAAKNEDKNDGGAAEVQAKVDETEEKGYFGTTPDPFPNEAYSLKSGPDSPTHAETREALAADAAAKEDSK